jgi:uncharacterized protein (DUF302 family)
MSPTRKPAATLAATLLLVSGMAGAQAPSAAAPPPAAAAAPLIQLPPTRPREDFVPNTMAPAISPEARANFIANLMAVNPFSLRDMIAMMATRYPVKAGLSFDEVVESMKLKANELNFKLVGHNPLWKDVAAITGKPTPRIEFFTFCDAMVAREILDYSLEFAVFLPCRIAVVEDAHKQLLGDDAGLGRSLAGQQQEPQPNLRCPAHQGHPGARDHRQDHARRRQRRLLIPSRRLSHRLRRRKGGFAAALALSTLGPPPVSRPANRPRCSRPSPAHNGPRSRWPPRSPRPSRAPS